MKNKNIWSLSIVIIGTLGILSLVIHDAFVTNPGNPFMSLHLFKYFTVLSNLVAVIYFWVNYALKKDLKNERWKNLTGGVMIYTTITFLIFLFFLETRYNEEGLSLLGSILLHYLNPIVIIAFFVYYRKTFLFTKKDPFLWIIFPVVYLVFVIIWGSITGDFLYPFFQVSEIGVLGLIVSILGLIALFFVLSFSLVKIVSRK